MNVGSRTIGLAWVLLSVWSCKSYDPSARPTGTFDACCEGAGICVPAGALPEALAPQLAADSCGNALLCAPAVLVNDPRAVLPTCRAAGNLEGRCMSSCLPEVARQADLLKQDACGGGDLCVPCFDPVTGKDSGACRLGGDPGPQEPARVFAPCCEARGRCVPASILPADNVEQLGRDVCTEPDARCVPEAWLPPATPSAATCRAAGDLEGRCLPACLPEVARQADRLQQASCSTGERCVPCFDPITGKDLGSCRLGTDPGPTSPRVFPRCCGGIARCVPRELVPAEGSDDLMRLDCGGAKDVCVPEAWLEDPMPIPASCRAPGGLEGRCLPGCLLGQEAELLQRVTCATGEVCAPCFDPLTGRPTGSCEIGEDPGPVEPAKQFGECCDGRARCVPRELVPTSNAAQVMSVDCANTQEACVPEEWLSATPPAPATCRAPGDLEGRCLLSCLLGKQAETLSRATCGSAEVCAPCFDPRTGEDLGSCSIGSDPGPLEPAKEFGRCCGGRARCVPRELVPGSGAAQLSQLDCEQAEAVCVPEPWLEDPAPAAVSCRAPGNLEGRCIPDCLAADLGLTQESCTSGEVCAPCYDPLTLRPTDVCGQRGDPPVDPPRGFTTCCGMEGTCVPVELLTADQRTALPVDTCQGYDARCVPTQLLARDFDSLSCGTDGVCLSECFISTVARLVLPVETCAADQRCVPCSEVGCE